MVDGKFTRTDEETKKSRKADYGLARTTGYTPRQAARIRDWRSSKVRIVCASDFSPINRISI
jgi:hypothetical protein